MKRIFNNVKNRFKYCFYDYWHHKLAMSNIKNNRAGKLSKDLICNGLSRLSCAKKGTCKFISACCEEGLAHRLSEMGFTPGGDIKVVARSGSHGSIMVEVKGSKLALSDRIANEIIIRQDDGLPVK